MCNVYAARLRKLKMWPIVAFVAIVAPTLLAQMAIVYWIYIPNLLSPIENAVSPAVETYLHTGIYKVAIGFGAWAFASILLNILLVYVLWNVKKHFELVGTAQ